MKALLSLAIGCGGFLAALTSGLGQATSPGPELPTPEVAANAPTAPDKGAAPAAAPDSGSAPGVPEKSAEASPASSPASSQSAPAPSAPASENVTINLINRLVQRGVLTKDDASELIKQAEADAVKAREQATAANRSQTEQPPSPEVALFRGDQAPPAPESTAPPPASPPPPGRFLGRRARALCSGDRPPPDCARGASRGDAESQG